MLEASARLLRLLSLLQTRADWTGAELAERLQVSVRTVRYDIGKLRDLGYPVHAVPGAAGGYRLGAGAALPPLLLDDEEAVAVAVSLRTAAGGTVTGIEETSVRALAKLEQVLPSRLRRRVGALHDYTTRLTPGGPTVSADVLATVAAACRDHRRLRFGYRKHDGSETARDVEPYRLVHTGRRWYLTAWDVARDGWRTFRVDRLTPRTPRARGSPRASRLPRTWCRAGWTPRWRASRRASPSTRRPRRSRPGYRRPSSSSRWTAGAAWSTRAATPRTGSRSTS
ncbi:Proteasome accessory factor B [Actinomadura madurae]|nr:WYL domain-containing protein [Actinomadura madurae]SPT58193.1 Proteasome accessory factor B [Actinomadura madurae]